MSAPTALTRVLLLRHAESADPTVFHGAESDVGLSARGRLQAEAVAPLLAAEQPTVVVSSAMRRAFDTATPIARAAGVPLRVEPALHERRVGGLSGAPFGHEGIWPETLRRWLSGETAYAPAGAESLEDIRARVLPVWDRLAQELAGRTYVMVAHGVVCKTILVSRGTGAGVADWERLGPTRNVAVNELVLGPTGWTIVRVNDLPDVVARL